MFVISCPKCGDNWYTEACVADKLSWTPEVKRLEVKALALSMTKLSFASVRDIRSFTPASHPYCERGKVKSWNQ